MERYTDKQLSKLSKKDLLNLYKSARKELESKNKEIERAKTAKTTKRKRNVTRVLGGVVLLTDIDIVNNFDPSVQLYDSIENTAGFIDKRLRTNRGLKVQQILEVAFTKMRDTERIDKNAVFNSKAVIVTNSSQTTNVLNEINEEILERIENWIKEGSNWTVD